MLGAPGAGKGTQAHVLAATSGCPGGDRATSSGRQPGTGRRSGSRPGAYMERGELVPDEITVGMLLERLAPRTPVRGVILDGFPRTRPRPRPSTGSLAERGGRGRRGALIDVPAEELLPPPDRALGLQRGRPHVPRRCTRRGCRASATSTGRRWSSATTTGRRRPGPAREAAGALYDVVDHYRPPASCRRWTATADRRVTNDLLERRADPGLAHAARDHAQSRRRDRDDAPRRAARRRGAGPRRGGAPTRRHHGPPGRDRRGAHPAGRRRRRRSWATRATRSLASASRSTTRSSTASRRPDDRATARSSPSMPARSSTAGTATPRGPASWATRRREVRELVEATRLAMRGRHRGGASRATGSGTSRAAVEDVALPRGYGVVRSFVGHGIGTEMHEEPAGPELPHRRRAGSSWSRASAWRSSRCSRWAVHDVETLADGWTVVTRDGSLAAHWEHTLAVTVDGPGSSPTARDGGLGAARLPGSRRESGTLRVRVPGPSGRRLTSSRRRNTQGARGPRRTRSKSRERSSSRCRTPCSPSSWRTATAFWPTSAASSG